MFWVPTSEGGVRVFGSRGGFEVGGTDVHRWLVRLLPFLDGTHSLAELTKSLTPVRREKVESIVERLYRRGLLEDVGKERAHSLSQVEQRLYASQLDYLAQHTDAAGQRFQSYRERQVLVLGEGLMSSALLAAALRSGCRLITLALVDPDEASAARAYAIAGTARQAEDPRCIVIEPIPPGATAVHHRTELERLVAESGAVIHLSKDHKLASALDRWCAKYDKVLAQGVVAGRQAWLGPVNGPGAYDWPWAAAGRRLSCWPSNHVEPTGDAAAEEALNGPQCAMAANALVQRLVNYTTGIDGGSTGKVLRLDLASLSTSTHQFLPHPLALPAEPRTAAEFLRRISELQTGPALADASFARAAAACLDERAGILAGLDERHFHQLPFWVAEVRVSDPVGLLALRGASPKVYGAGFEFSTARHRAVRRALLLYASAVLDQRRLVHRHGAPAGRADGQETGNALWGWRIDDGQACLLPVRQVFGTNDDYRSALPLGVASGSSFHAAVEAALLQHCEALTVAASRTSQEVRTVDLAHAELDDVGRRLLSILRLLGADVRAYEITGALAVPTFTLYLGDRAVTHIARWTPAEALRDGLEQVLLAHQSLVAGEPEYHPPAVPTWLRPQRPLSPYGPYAPTPAASLAGDERVFALARALLRHGWRPVVVPLDHDPALSKVMPYALRVIMETGEDAG